MSKKVYERLLQDFRDEWCKHRDAPFNIEIFAPSSFSTESPPYDRERYELLAQVALPFDATREITLDGDNSTLFGWAVVKKDERTTEARESFRRLCDQAGAAMPSPFRERLSGLCHWHMSEPATWWIALLVYRSGQSAYGRNGSYQGRVLLLQPFLLCVRTIEQCRLNTDNPEFPERNTGVSASGADEDGPAAGGEPAAPPEPPPPDETPKTTEGIFSATELARGHNVPLDALRKRLARWRRANDKGWHEVAPSERGPRDPQFLYNEKAVSGVISDLKKKLAEAENGRRTAGENKLGATKP